ncbi:hypothetical protein HQN86_24830 [Pedobacter panaciterrae]|uniref:hypothetical protein n=1 Tax=Pedobacter panaciterrae TaxID=363849 RepID=UPI00155DA8FA|nr:hypothetical protein [Pedobacter panaciterrae]NQX56866.1 hypothetical protein [Pedobacter panaciterrae]
MKTKPVNVFIIDDEFPKIPEFRKSGIYNSAISKDNLFHLAVNSDWVHLAELQQLIIDIISSEASEEGLIDLFGFSTPTQALQGLEENFMPDIIIYDWEYPNAQIYSQNAKNWLIDLLKSTTAFIFVYSKKGDELPKLLNTKEFIPFVERFQLFVKSRKNKSTFSSEEFILQYIIGSAKDSGSIKISGIPIKFTSNNYLDKASDILFLQRILGNEYVLEEMNKIDFIINASSVEKVLNDAKLFLYINRMKGYLITPDNHLLKDKQLDFLEKISYVDILKEFSIDQLEETLEKGFLNI